jgi:hypothetical protein
VPLAARVTPERRLRDLEEVYDGLMAEWRATGGVGFPAAKISELLKVGDAIGRLSAVPATAVPEDDGGLLAAVLELNPAP